MLQLLAPRIIQRHRARLAREFALDDQVLARCRKILQATLKSGLPRPRSELYARLESAGVSTEGQRGIHILGRLAQEGLVCYGPRIGKQATFVLLDEWLPPVPPLTREESLGELARRYFTSHGPATLGDFTWWSGLTAREGREAISLLGSGLTEKVNHGESYWSGGRAYPRSDRGSLHLLPPFDEYLVGYKQRADVLEARYTKRVRMLLSPVIEIGGRIAGTWGREITRSGMKIRLQSFKKVGPGDRTSLTAAAEQYAEFFGAACSVEIR
jgi:hypothetical protein